MSFKRDGDDKNWLNHLQKRRVSELLSFDIPDEEALLTRNGRFACLVCPQKPVFDTVNVLAVHRAGKKHKENYEWHLKEKEDLRSLKLARCHEEYIKYGKIVTKQLENEVKCETFVKSLGAAPYDPRMKKKKPTERKHRVLLDDAQKGSDQDILPYRGLIISEATSSQPGFSNIYPNTSHQAAAQNCSIEKSKDYISDKISEDNKSPEVSTYKQNKNEKIAKSSTVSRIESQTISDFRKQQAYEERIAKLKVRPYISKGKKNASGAKSLSFSIAKFVDTKNSSLFSDTTSPVDSASKHNVSDLSCSQTAQITSSCDTNSTNRCKVPDMQSNFSNLGYFNCKSEMLKCERTEITRESSAVCKSLKRTVGGTGDIEQSTCKKLIKPNMPSKSNKSFTKAKTNYICDDKRQAAVKYLQAIGSGWKKDRSGNWVKDEDAEFDSDDEPPDIP